MGPFELAALWMVLQMVALLGWIARRYESQGAAAPEFEAWCKTERPVIFAMQCAPGRAAALGAELAASLGDEGEVLHHRGRHPWTLYVFTVALQVDPLRNVVVGRVVRCTLRRGGRAYPEIGGLVDRMTSERAADLRALWVHADLRHEDDVPGPDRRERGWIVPFEGGASAALVRTAGPPAWARAEMAMA
jgi:hypothetical protein